MPCRGAGHFVSKGVLGLEIYKLIRGDKLYLNISKYSALFQYT